MEPFNQLFAQYDPWDVVIIVILVLFCLKSLVEAGMWAYKVIKDKFHKDSKTERVVEEHEDLEKKIEGLSNDVKSLCDATKSIKDGLQTLNDKHDVLQSKIEDMEDNQHDIQERFLYYTRVYIIDKYHYYCYQKHQIDEVTRDNIENQYTQYKLHGGNSFIDGLMDQIRALPLAKPDFQEEHERG